MSRIEVQTPGLLTTVQDLGRPGYAALGVSASGAADALSLRLGNRLVGNDEGAAGLEMTLLGGTFKFEEREVVALAGSEFVALLDGERLEVGRSVEVRAGQTLHVGPATTGARCYLCVRGGIRVKPFLGSASTHLLSGLGGLEGRALRKGDVLRIGRANSKIVTRRIARQAAERLWSRKVLRVTAGPQVERFSESAQRWFYGGRYRVGEQSNRQGLQLLGSTVPQEGGGVMITEGVSLGAIQVPGGGAPIILFVEQQTTGGYPKIANVIAADMHRVGQLRPRDEVRFERVTTEEARELLIEQERMLAAGELIAE